MSKGKIGFAGNGWGAVVAVKSLQKFFDIECLSTDVEVKEVLNTNDSIVNEFNKFGSSLIVCAGYKPIVPPILIEKYNILNVHYSLLPNYRGLHSTAWAIMNGERELGWTLHEMNVFVDDGPIVFQKSTKNDGVSTVSYYMSLMNKQVKELLGKSVFDYYLGNIIPIEQDKTKASWVAKRGVKHNLIDFTEGFETCSRLFRVLQEPYPRPKFMYKGNEYSVENVKFKKSIVVTDLGRILNIDNEGVWVGCKEGFIVLNNIKDVNEVSVEGYWFKLGIQLND